MSRTVVATTDFPRGGDNLTREEATQRIATYVGGADNPQQRTKAGYCWDEAVNRYNSVMWTFNRTSQDITLSATNEFDLESNIYMPERCYLLDSSGYRRRRVVWTPYEEFVVLEECDVTTGTVPERYTIFNVHYNGVVRIYPKISGTATYPTMQLVYFKRIGKASSPAARLDVPVEVDQGIFDLAVAIMITRVHGPSASREFFADARGTRTELERTWRGYPDIPEYGEA